MHFKIVILICLTYCGFINASSIDTIGSELAWYKGKKILIVRVVDDAIYVVSENDLYYQKGIEDKPQKISKYINDLNLADISDIEFSYAKKELWITTNGNRAKSRCYLPNDGFTTCSSLKNNMFGTISARYPESLNKGSVMSYDYDAISKNLVISIFKGASYLFNNDNLKGRTLWRPKRTGSWARDVATTKGVSFSIHKREGLAAFNTKTGNVEMYSTTKKIRSIDANEDYLLLGGTGLFIKQELKDTHHSLTN